jgi:hypothetical protein
MLRKPRGWAVDTSALDDARALGAVNVAVTDTETETAYITPIDTFFRYGVPLNRGFGPQLVLPLGYWSVDGKPPRMGEPPQPNQPAPDTPRQLPLFAEV